MISILMWDQYLDKKIWWNQIYYISLYLIKPSMFDKKFKISYECRNGKSGLNVEIMNPDGVFVHILSKYDLGFFHGPSYVSNQDNKDKDFYKGFELCKEVISKIYS